MTLSDEYAALKLANQLCFPLYAAARQVVSLYTPYLAPLGITYTQYIVFLVLWEGDNITVGELGRLLHLNNGTLTPMLKKMEKDGRITRKRDEADERVVRIGLTDEGRAFREQAKDIPTKIRSCIPISQDEARELYGILYEILGSSEDSR